MPLRVIYHYAGFIPELTAREQLDAIPASVYPHLVEEAREGLTFALENQAKVAHGEKEPVVKVGWDSLGSYIGKSGD